MKENNGIPTPDRSRGIRHNVWKTVLKLLSWTGAALLYFILFSLMFDTPAEYELRHSTDRMREEYEILSARCDSLSSVVDNVIERDRNIFGIMFESQPYDLTSEYEQHRLSLYEKLLDKSNRRMSKEMGASLNELEIRLSMLEGSFEALQDKFAMLGDNRNYIPSIQPVTNHQLTLLTAPYGSLMHPFYKTMHSHQGVDYTIPEGSRIFATADGVVKSVSGKNSTSGLTVEINHRNGYTTSYSHLQSAKVKRGQTVKRGDIIALSGNSGLSLAPHLHYEVRYEGVRVDPIHYFFMELTPDEYRRIMTISKSGMQSFD